MENAALLDAEPFASMPPERADGERGACAAEAARAASIAMAIMAMRASFDEPAVQPDPMPPLPLRPREPAATGAAARAIAPAFQAIPIRGPSPLAPRPPPRSVLHPPLQVAPISPAAAQAAAISPAVIPVAGTSVIPVAGASAAPSANSPGRSDRRNPLFRSLRWGLGVVLASLFGLLVLVLGLIVAYRVVDPPHSMLTLWATLGGRPVDQRWVPLSDISPHLVRAVVMSEDARFCRHTGIDLEELELAIERAQDGIPRGGSTISMQLTKNLFLWQAKSYVRKAIELPLTLVLEAALPKTRILEIYLNVAEWGPGVYGAEAAARRHFGKPAARLGEREAALLAVTLPSPRTRNPGNPGPGLQRMAGTIQARMRAADAAVTCIGPTAKLR